MDLTILEQRLENDLPCFPQEIMNMVMHYCDEITKINLKYALGMRVEYKEVRFFSTSILSFFVRRRVGVRPKLGEFLDIITSMGFLERINFGHYKDSELCLTIQPTNVDFIKYYDVIIDPEDNTIINIRKKSIHDREDVHMWANYLTSRFVSKELCRKKCVWKPHIHIGSINSEGTDEFKLDDEPDLDCKCDNFKEEHGHAYKCGVQIVVTNPRALCAEDREIYLMDPNLKSTRNMIIN